MRLRAPSLALILALPVPAVALPLEDASSLLVFGDSLSDTGNLPGLIGPLADVVVPSPPYFDYRRSNGPLWADVAEDVVGSGTNFAYSGARADGAGTSPIPIPDFEAQIGAYVGALGGGFDPGDAPLAAVWFGANDIFQSLGTPGLGDAITAAVDAIGDGIDQLFALGIEDFAVFNLPDLSITPRFLGQSFAADASRTFNDLLALEIAGAPGDVVGIDIEALFDGFIADPSGFEDLYPPFEGITVIDEPCITGAFPSLDVCADPERYAFYDAVHPTTDVHAVVALAVERTLSAEPSVVPLPAGAPLLVLGLGALAAVRRRRG